MAPQAGRRTDSGNRTRLADPRTREPRRRLVGRASCVDAPLQGFSYGVTLRVAQAPPGRPSQGSSRLSEFLSERRSGSLVRRSLLVVSTTSRSSAVRPPASASTHRVSHRLGPPSQGSGLTADPSGRSPPDAPRGVRRPYKDMGDRVRFTRACLTRHVPPSRFLTSPTVYSPATSRPRRPLPLMGFQIPHPASVTVCRALRPGEQIGPAATRSHTLRNMRPNASG